MERPAAQRHDRRSRISPRSRQRVFDYLKQHPAAADRCEVVDGDFFQSVPTGRDAYVLKHVLHDREDDHCAIILANCRRAMRAGGRLLIVEALLPAGNEPGYGKYLDVNMLVLNEGRERTEAEYAHLLSTADFRLSRVATGSEISIIESLPV